MSAADDLRALSTAATPGPWEAGDIWSWAGCGFNGNGPDECVLCDHMGDPAWTGKADINGKRMHAHKHRNPHPYAIDHRISGPDDEVAGNYDHEEGGIIDPDDLALIVWCRNHADALADLADTVKAIPRHYPYGGPEVEDVTGKCLVCGTSWPCPTERAHRALDALEANRG